MNVLIVCKALHQMGGPAKLDITPEPGLPIKLATVINVNFGISNMIDQVTAETHVVEDTTVFWILCHVTA